MRKFSFMKKSIVHYAEVTVGLILLGLGLYLLSIINEPQGIMKTLPFLLIGLGCGIFGHGIGEFISRRLIEKNPEIENQIRIEKLDERNVAIENRAKAKAFDLMILLFGALLFTLTLLRVDMVIILLLVFAYLFVVGFSIFFRIKYEREM